MLLTEWDFKKMAMFFMIGIFVTLCSAGNVLANSWAYKQNMPTPRTQGSAVLCNDKIYVLGGWNKLDGRLKTVDAYDPVGNTWESKESMSTARNYFS